MRTENLIFPNSESTASFKFHAGMGIGTKPSLEQLYGAWVAQGELLLERHAIGIDLDVASINNFVRLHRVLMAEGILGRRR